jgi:hypothetical protein
MAQRPFIGVVVLVSSRAPHPGVLDDHPAPPDLDRLHRDVDRGRPGRPEPGRGTAHRRPDRPVHRPRSLATELLKRELTSDATRRRVLRSPAHRPARLLVPQRSRVPGRSRCRHFRCRHRRATTSYSCAAVVAHSDRRRSFRPSSLIPAVVAHSDRRRLFRPGSHRRAAVRRPPGSSNGAWSTPALSSRHFRQVPEPAICPHRAATPNPPSTRPDIAGPQAADDDARLRVATAA